MDELLTILRKNLDGDEFRIDHPRRTLEEFFLDVIASAKRDSVETSGVVDGGKIADYLAPDADKNDILQALLENPAAQAAPPVAEKELLPPVAAEAAVSQRIADALDEKPVEKKPEITPDADAAEKLRNANKKLDSLLDNLDGSDDK